MCDKIYAWELILKKTNLLHDLNKIEYNPGRVSSQSKRWPEGSPGEKEVIENRDWISI